jgi:hypothetical protein
MSRVIHKQCQSVAVSSKGQKFRLLRKKLGDNIEAPSRFSSVDWSVTPPDQMEKVTAKATPVSLD